jgi:hypothetical protein
LTAGIKANVDGSAAIQVGGVDAITLTSAGAASFVTSPTSLAGNLTFTGTGNRITGDMNNATVANRLFFQNSVTNGSSQILMMPNGTGTASSFIGYNSSDPANASLAAFQVIGSTDVRIQSTIAGTGTYLPMTFYTGGTETARLSATAKTLILSGGNTTANGTGITFPDTWPTHASSNANTLDDYEEGTWNITVSYSGSTSGVVYAARSGYYTKIGNVVTVQGAVSLSSKGTGSGTILISLPFQSFNERGGLAVGNTQSITGNNSPRELLVEASTAYFFIRYPTGSGSTGEIQYADISNSFYIAFGGSYLVV